MRCRRLSEVPGSERPDAPWFSSAMRPPRRSRDVTRRTITYYESLKRESRSARNTMVTRTDCPSNAELSAFQLGEIGEQHQDRIAEHLEVCPLCEARARAYDS